MRKLTDKQIQQKLAEGRNYKRLYLELKDRYDKVTSDLKAENETLKEQLAVAHAKLDTQAIQIAELQAMVFGKHKRPPTGTAVPAQLVAPKKPRTKASYRRPLPPASAITSSVPVPLPETCTCGGKLKSVSEHERYQEDVPLPELTANYQAKLVTKYIISRGVCTKCGKLTSGQELGGQAVTLGPNVRLLICHLVSAVGMSYTQVANLLLSLYGLTVSDGEIASTIQKQHQDWLPAYDQLKADIRGAPAVHADETPWAIQQNDGYGYAWCLSDANSQRVYYSLESSRGARPAHKLFGDQFTGVRISDDYGAYRSLPGIQQLCWAHLYRAIRDLRYNDNLPKDQLPYVTQWYEQFVAIYQDLRTYLGQPHNQATRASQSHQLWQRLVALLTTNPAEPTKLTKLKAQLQRAGQAKLFACLAYDTPCDNNRAERDLRQLVLKRKRSFGSQTEKGAKALSTILSLCTTTWRMQPNGYFKALAELG